MADVATSAPMPADVVDVGKQVFKIGFATPTTSAESTMPGGLHSGIQDAIFILECILHSGMAEAFVGGEGANPF